MAGYNRIILVGNLTRDPDFKQLASGQPVCQLGVASNRQYRNKQTGALVQEVCFVDVDVFGPQAESCNQYLQKGRAVLIEGRLKFDSWETQEGQKRNKHSIVADRVIFLSANAGVETENFDRAQSTGQQDELAKELLSDEPASTQKSSSAPRPEVEATRTVQPAQKEDSPETNPESSSDAGELAFKDEPPFQDDLPF